MSSAVTVRVEELEPRLAPAQFGDPWPDGSHLTLSLAPDGTSIGGQSSNLAAELAPLGLTAARMEILRAFQSWAAVANVNVGLVSDGGQPFGSRGTVQGDPNFGDLRVGGRALPRDVLAVTAPPNLYDRNSGDVTVNTAAPFNLGPMPGRYDLFTVLLQESGHSLGVGNSPDPSSAMYEYYQGARAGLSAADIASIQALYGPRVPDQYEGRGGDDTPATAAWYGGPLEAELTTPADVDVYKFVADPLNNGVRVDLHAAGLSLLTARVELLDAAGRVVAVASSTDPTANELTLGAGRLNPFGTYFVRVSAARPDVFGVGAYDLRVTQATLVNSLATLLGNVVNETGLNDTLASATTLLSATLGVSAQTEYHVRAGFGSPSDVDYYKIVVPPSADGSPVNLLTTVWGLNGASLTPWVQVSDALGRPLPEQVVTADQNATTVQVLGVVPGQAYFVRVASDTGSVGDYELAADLRAAAVAFDQTTQGTAGGTQQTAATLSMAQSDQVHLVLSALNAPSGSSVEVVVLASDGTTAARFTAVGGRARSLDVYLPAGGYRLAVRATAGSAVNYTLAADVVTDPTGSQMSDPTDAPTDGGTGTAPPDSSSGGTSPSGNTTWSSAEPTQDSWWY